MRFSHYAQINLARSFRLTLCENLRCVCVCNVENGMRKMLKYTYIITNKPNRLTVGFSIYACV